MASGFPKLPGFTPTQQLLSSYKKVSHVQLEKNRDVKKNEVLQYPLPRQEQHLPPDQQKMTNPNYTSTTHATFIPKMGEDPTTLFQPKWVKMDRHVLRFYGYFREGVVQSEAQTSRVRKLIICFYLEDNSISATEQKQQNSGIPQGYFLKRQKCLKSDGTGKFLSPSDFQVGDNIIIYGKNIRIYDCDQYTRQFFTFNNMSQKPRQEPVIDQWTYKHTNKYVPVKDAQMKNYLQYKLGVGKVTPQKQFLQNDRKVLKFYAFSQNQNIIHYFLADDTIQVRQVSIPNSGRDPFPVSFKRQKLPRKFLLNQPGQTYAQDFLTCKDISVNEPLKVFGREYQILGCDQFTHHYYLHKHGIDFPVMQKQQPNNAKISNIIIPPYNGFGDQQDSLGFVYRLDPKPPKKDFFKWVDHQTCLRFTAKFNTDKPQDQPRKFIINYYLNDDSLQIYQPPVRNSGFSQGKFLQRGVHKNISNNNEKFTPIDLIIGKDLKINGYSFHITDADQFTKKWYAKHTQYA